MTRWIITNMRNKNFLESELIEFFILGFVLFMMVFGIFATKMLISQSGFNILYKDISFPNRGLKKIESSKLLKTLPGLSTIDDSKTPCNPKDDVVNYNTSYFSIVLPYDLAFYTDRYGSNNAVRRLVEAHKQFYRQLLENKIIDSDQQQATYNQMLILLNTIIENQDDIYLFTKHSKTGSSTGKNVEIDKIIKQIKLNNNELVLFTEKNQDSIRSTQENQNYLSSNEATIIVYTLNEHIILLNNKAIADYYNIVYKKGYDYRTFKKPEITNTIEILESRLNNTDLQPKSYYFQKEWIGQ